MFESVVGLLARQVFRQFLQVRVRHDESKGARIVLSNSIGRISRTPISRRRCRRWRGIGIRSGGRRFAGIRCGRSRSWSSSSSGSTRRRSYWCGWSSCRIVGIHRSSIVVVIVVSYLGVTDRSSDRGNCSATARAVAVAVSVNSTWNNSVNSGVDTSTYASKDECFLG